MKRFLSVLFVLAVALSLTGCKSSEYKEAKELAADGEYTKAITAFTALGDYKDSKERAVVLQIEEYKKELITEIDDMPSLSISSYSSGTADLKTLANDIIDFATDFNSTDFADDEDLSEAVEKLRGLSDGIIQLIALDEESISEFFGPDFYMFPSTMQLSIQNSESMLHSWANLIPKIELPEKYDGWY